MRRLASGFSLYGRGSDGEAHFLANYSDALTDLPLNGYLDRALASGAVASLLAVVPPQSFHALSLGTDGWVTGMTSLATSGVRINGGYFMFGAGIFDHMRAGEDLVAEPFARLIKAQQMFAYPYDGFWMPMDTFKDSIHLNRRYSADDAPWELWRTP